VNSSLYDKEIEFPSDKRRHMKICFKKAVGADSNTEGYLRNKELQDQKFISYKQLKRIKNFFDNFKGNENELPFILNGGVEIKNWVNNELRRMRDYIKTTKTNKMNTGMQNQFLDPHEKKDFTNVRVSQKHLKTTDKYDVAVTENLKRINEIMSKL
jgi:hypothetical protein